MARAAAPGRVNLIGEHTDYNEGFVLPASVARHTTVDVDARLDDRVTVTSEGFGSASYRLGDERRAGDWVDHVRGVTWTIAEAGMRVGGFDAHVRSDIPAGAGLGSSAALAVALLRAMRTLFGLTIDDVALALLAHRAERELVGANVGTMDQLAASLGREGEALLIDTRSLAIERVALPREVTLVVIDSGVAHAHATGEYNTRRAECEAAARALGLSALRDATLADVARLGGTQARRARHVVSENERVVSFVRALRAGDLAACGGLLDASHASLRDDFEVSTVELDALVALLREQDGVYGARLVGGGFGGSVLALVAPARAANASARALDAYVARTGRAARVLLA